MFDRHCLNVANLGTSKRFYLAALGPLHLRLLNEGERWTIIGGERGRLWIGAFCKPVTPIHVAASAGSRGQVDRF